MRDSLVLKKSRKIAAILHKSNEDKVAFDEVCSVLSDAVSSDCSVLSRKGKILGTAVSDIRTVSDEILNLPKGSIIDKDVNESLLDIGETKEFSAKNPAPWTETDAKDGRMLIVPIIMKGIRIGTLIVGRLKEEYEDEDIILAEYAATVVGLEMEKSMSQEMAEENRKISTARASISSLSDEEVKAAYKIFEELRFLDGVMFAGNIADDSGISKTVLVGTLRKLEKAGLIETKSSGMKGTYIHILNDAVIEEIQNTLNENEG